jgi:hypothetical protein
MGQPGISVLGTPTHGQGRQRASGAQRAPFQGPVIDIRGHREHLFGDTAGSFGPGQVGAEL